MGWLTQLALDAFIWPLPPPLECVWKILDQRSQRRPISPYPRSRRRSGSKKPSKSGCFFSHFRDFWWFFHHWDLPEPPGGKYSIPKCSAWNFIKFETLSNQVRGHSEAQKRKNCEKNPLVIRHFRDFWWFFHHWDLPEPPGGKYGVPKCSAWNFIKFETLSNQVRGHSEAQKHKNCEKIHSDSTFLMS